MILPISNVRVGLLAAIFVVIAGSAMAAAPTAGTTVAPITRIDVFVVDATPIAAGTEATQLANAGTLLLWNLDDLDRINAALSANLPSDRDAAVRVVAERATSLSADQQQALSKAANGQARADALRVTRVPAVVINESKIYYGARSIEAAIAAYRSGQ
jgi:integrating conjugative element protein (TIGR03757 family)